LYSEKFATEFQNSKLANNYSTNILINLDLFIQEESSYGYELLNPYKFALDYGISTENSLKLFLFFTDDEKIFRLESFVDCPSCTGKRLEVSQLEFPDEDIIYCDDCCKDYQVNQIQNQIYVYFKLNNIEHPLNEELLNDRFDHNSTIDIFNRLNGNLKVKSPSSSESSTNDSHIDAGGSTNRPMLKDIIRTNIDSDGNSISISASKHTSFLMTLMMTDEAVG
jgi:hypothetical protein